MSPLMAKFSLLRYLIVLRPWGGLPGLDQTFPSDVGMTQVNQLLSLHRLGDGYIGQSAPG